MKAEMLDVYVQNMANPLISKRGRYVGKAPSDENYGLVGRRFGYKGSELLNGTVQQCGPVRIWLLMVWKDGK